MLLARSAPEGEVDEIGAKADIAARTSAVGGKPDVTATWPGSPLLAISRSLEDGDAGGGSRPPNQDPAYDHSRLSVVANLVRPEVVLL